ncbi:hypothetical protein B0T19DRAFT_111938 [Cercophora scortea]|uniref:Secreted protein n=1 Tax=Cercophora scortea TaxID=314031 RepID=A0AAE0IX04_9PEZI|nr:hypothetical protein B0T19DRAFT_111938 [Cercophora scortea]
MSSSWALLFFSLCWVFKSRELVSEGAGHREDGQPGKKNQSWRPSQPEGNQRGETAGWLVPGPERSRETEIRWACKAGELFSRTRCSTKMGARREGRKAESQSETDAWRTCRKEGQGRAGQRRTEQSRAKQSRATQSGAGGKSALYPSWFQIRSCGDTEAAAMAD